MRLLSRNDNDRTETFAGDRRGGRARCRERTLLLDGEAVAFDRQGRLPLPAAPARRRATSRRLRLSLPQRPGPAARAARRRAARSSRRRARSRLDGLFCRAGSPRRTASPPIAIARRRGFEGLVAKDASSLYEERRSIEVAQGQGAPGRGARDRRLHAAARRARASRRASARRLPRAASCASSARSEPGSPGTTLAELSRAAARRSCARDRAVRESAAREGRDVARARARRADRVPGDDRRREAAPAGVPRACATTRRRSA